MKKIFCHILAVLIIGSSVSTSMHSKPALVITQNDREAAYNQCRKEHLIRLGAETIIPAATFIASLLITTLITAQLGPATDAHTPAPPLTQTPAPQVSYRKWFLSGMQNLGYDASKSAISTLIAYPAISGLNICANKFFEKYKDTVTVIPSTLSFLRMQAPLLTGTIIIKRSLYNFALAVQRFNDSVQIGDSVKAHAALSYIMGHLDWSAEHSDDSIIGMGDWVAITTIRKELVALVDREEDLGKLHVSVTSALDKLTKAAPYSLTQATAY